MHIAGHNVPVAGLVNFIPVLATIVTTILSIVLARATLRYAHAADRTLELAHEQFEREWAPELHLRMERTAATDARLVITNLAKTSVLLQLVQLRSTDHALPFEKQYLNEPLVGGTAWTHPIGERLLHLTGDNFQGTVAASASFYCSGRLFRTDWFRFKVEVRNGRIDRIAAVTLPAHRVRVLEPHHVRRFRKQPLVKDVAKEVVETTKVHS
ncbi:MAG: hypothetical protein ACHP79_01475 [Terriglobales bacterium]